MAERASICLQASSRAETDVKEPANNGDSKGRTYLKSSHYHAGGQSRMTFVDTPDNRLDDTWHDNAKADPRTREAFFDAS
jgi:hypothetical protein